MLDCSPHRPRAASVVGALETFASSVALHVPGGAALTYGDLGRRVKDVAESFGTGRRLVLLEAGNDVASIVAYLAALKAGCPLLLAGGGDHAVENLTATYDPDVVVTTAGANASVRHRRSPVAPSPHRLHPDLALMLSTSGSTGSPKVVRLSSANLDSNAESIASYLGLASDDRAMTSLPMNYCYGLSVINSHVVRGASIVVSDRSVVEAQFWDDFRAAGATSFAGVPYTFDVLDRIGFDDMVLPRLRHVTQAGGRMPPATVRRYASLGAERGWRLFVMYGQTEATARMAYLPPEHVIAHPRSIGVAIPGGRFDLTPVDDHEDDAVGELVYEGPNVMLGYAEGPGDLALGRTTTVLHTGDLARRDEGGLYEIVGRRSRFLKLFGLRLDLDRIEHALAEAGHAAACAGDDSHLVIAFTGPSGPEEIVAFVARRFNLPANRVSVRRFESLPRLANGKVDHAAIAGARTDGSATAGAAVAGTDVRALFADVFPGRPIALDATFVGLGGDSLSYVEMSIRLEEALGHLPQDWPSLSVRELSPAAVANPDTSHPRSRRSRWHSVETSVVVRAAAVVSVVAGHAGLVRVRGGAHVLLMVAGFNFARFQLAGARARAGRPRLGATIGRIAIPTVAWTAVLLAATDDYGGANLALVNSQIGEPFWDQRWRYWYVEAIVSILALSAVVLAVAPLRRLERADPFRFALGWFIAALGVRIALFDLGTLTRVTHRPQTVVWIFALGWLAAVAGTAGRRLTVGVLALATVPGFFVNEARTLMVVGAIALVLWIPMVRVPAALRSPVRLLASASLYIYLFHWQVYPAVLAGFPPAVAVAASLAVGVAGWRLSELATAALGPLLSSGAPPRAHSRSASSAAGDAIAPAPAG